MGGEDAVDSNEAKHTENNIETIKNFSRTISIDDSRDTELLNKGYRGRY